MNRIKFSEDWDKLREPRFTTIRSYRPDKEAYYRGLVGEEFTILRVRDYKSYIGRKIGSATLRRVRVVTPSKLPFEEIRRDTVRSGKTDEVWLQRLLKMNRALLLEFENHTGLLASKGDRPSEESRCSTTQRLQKPPMTFYAARVTQVRLMAEARAKKGDP